MELWELQFIPCKAEDGSADRIPIITPERAGPTPQLLAVRSLTPCTGSGAGWIRNELVGLADPD